MGSTNHANHHPVWLPIVRPHAAGSYQINTKHLSRNLPTFLEFLRDPPVDMNDMSYKCLSNGRLVVERREQVDETPTEVATEVATEIDSNNEHVLTYFDMDIEFGEEDMEIDEEFTDQKIFVVAHHNNNADAYFASTSINLKAHKPIPDADLMQGDNRGDKEGYPEDKKGCDGFEWLPGPSFLETIE